MIRKLTKQGNSLCLVIDRALRELMDIDAETPLKVSIEGRKLIVEPLSDEERDRRFKAALAETNAEYGRALKRLAE